MYELRAGWIRQGCLIVPTSVTTSNVVLSSVVPVTAPGSLVMRIQATVSAANTGGGNPSIILQHSSDGVNWVSTALAATISTTGPVTIPITSRATNAGLAVPLKPLIRFISSVPGGSSFTLNLLDVIQEF